MKTLVIMIILFGGGYDGGRAIDTSLKFHTMEECVAAAEVILKSTPKEAAGVAPARYSAPPSVSCVFAGK